MVLYTWTPVPRILRFDAKETANTCVCEATQSRQPMLSGRSLVLCSP